MGYTDAAFFVNGVFVKHQFERRHSRWYERILFSAFFQLLVGLVLVVWLPGWIRWDEPLLKWLESPVRFNTLLANSLAFLAVFVMVRRLQRFPGAQTLAYILPTAAVAWLFVVAVLFFMREDYSRQALFTSYLAANIWSLVGFFIGRRYRIPKLALVPFGRALSLENVPNAHVCTLAKPNLEGRRFDAVVADLYAEDLPPEWERFLARCTLARVPVYHIKQVAESLTGRVQIDHLSENEFGALLPSPYYEFLKRLIDLGLVLFTLPLWLPLMLITGIIIKLESAGPMFFIQERVGQGGKAFEVFKLRSMCKDSEKDGAQFASANDMRITRVGKFIRKTRLDEIPQFINVLKGEMSLIGPRPEQRVFVEQFEYEIPFYSYRHVVKPGITGWAQVVHGYAADAEDTQVKIEHDFYYIKHFSLWLDILIIFKTIRTIVTGFGAR